MIEHIRAYWDQRPCNINHSPKPVGSLAYSQQVTARKRFVEPHLWQFADFPAWAYKQVLDLGCGIGTEALEFAHRGAKVTALDLSDNSLVVARARFNSERLSANFIQGNMETYNPDLSGRFDLVWAWGTLHHTPNPFAALDLAHNYLKPGGLLRIMLYHRLSTKALRLWLKAGCPRNFDAAIALGSEAQERCPLTRTYTRQMARFLVETAGFKVSSIRVCHIFPWRADNYIQGRYIRGWPWRILPEKWLGRFLGWHLLIEATK